MTSLHMETDAVLAIAAQIKQAAESMRLQMQSSRNFAQASDWIGPSRDEFVTETESMIRQIESQLDIVINLAGRAENEVTEWEGVAAHLENQNAASSSEAVSQTSGYIHPENQNQATQERMDDIVNILSQTKEGRAILQYLQEHNIEIIFGSLGPEKIGFYRMDGKIIINADYTHLNDYELAATVLHEGAHARANPNIFESLNPNFVVHEEYDAYKAQADFWKAVKDEHNLPDNQNLDDVVNGIYDSDGSLRDRSAVSRVIEDAYSKQNPIYWKIFRSINPNS